MAQSAIGSAVSASREVEVMIYDPATSLSTGDAKAFLVIPSSLNGFNLTAVRAAVATVSSSGTPTVALRRERSGSAVDMLSTSITIDANEKSSGSAATPAVINGSNDDVQTDDLIYFDVDVTGTGTKGLVVALTFGP